MKLDWKAMLVLVLAGFISLAIIANFAGFHSFLIEVHRAIEEVLGGLWTGIEILFWVGLPIGLASFIVWGLKASREIRPGKYGQVQAIRARANEQWQLLPQTTVETDPAAQIKYIREIMKTGSQVALMTKRLEALPRPNEADQASIEVAELPDYVLYEDIRPDIPRRHALVGVDAQGVVSRKREDIKGLIWIVGASGTGKTRSVCIRIEEDYEYGHKFYLIDPHYFKPDSLWNALKDTPYAGRLERPMANDTDDIIAILDAFLSEFHRRKRGGQWNHPVTIIIDEVGSLTADKPETEEEKTLRDKIKQVARICGQEARGFDMAGIFISQDATGLSWLRNRALFVIAHQLNMMAERKLACNENMEMARSMDKWPRGRTYVYGIGLTSGPQLVQQPLYEPRMVEGTNGISAPISTTISELYPQDDTGYSDGDSTHPGGKQPDTTSGVFLDPAQKIKLVQVLEMDQNRSGQNDIIRSVWNCEPNTRAGQAAADELRSIRAFIAQEQRTKLGL